MRVQTSPQFPTFVCNALADLLKTFAFSAVNYVLSCRRNGKFGGQVRRSTRKSEREQTPLEQSTSTFM